MSAAGTFHRVPAGTFRRALEQARGMRREIADATTAPANLPSGARYYMSADGASGFGIASGDELIAVYSITRGNGARIMSAAIAAGAARLDCFDGYLPAFYRRHGFAETRREPNWTAGGPDVVYMERIGK